LQSHTYSTNIRQTPRPLRIEFSGGLFHVTFRNSTLITSAPRSARSVDAAPGDEGTVFNHAVFLPLALSLRATKSYQVGVLRLGSLAVALLAGWWLAQRRFAL
jgi:hypothetical protein